MSSQKYDVLKIHHKDPGWETDWHNLAFELFFCQPACSAKSESSEEIIETKENQEDEMESVEPTLRQQVLDLAASLRNVDEENPDFPNSPNERCGSSCYDFFDNPDKKEESYSSSSDLNDRMFNSPLGKGCKRAIYNYLFKHGTGSLIYGDTLTELEEFFSYMQFLYQKQVNEQTLFKDFQPETGNAVSFLCSSKWLFYAYQDFRKEGINKRIRSESVSIDSILSSTEDEEISILDNLKYATPSTDVAIEQNKSQINNQKLTETLDGNLVIKRPSQPQTARMAGLQLYPRLLPTDPDMKVLLNDVREKVVQTQSVSNPEAGIRILVRHQTARKVWRQENERLLQEQESHKFGTAIYNDIVDQIQKKQVDFYLRPLKINDICDLFGMSQDNATKSLNRYKQNWVLIFENLHRFLDTDEMEEEDND